MKNNKFKSSIVLSVASFCGLLMVGEPVSSNCTDEAAACNYAHTENHFGRMTKAQCVAACRSCIHECRNHQVNLNTCTWDRDNCR